ncbi:hypothetical protein [Rhodohalobacter barkolensis]|uniref:Uncharacterized protein n=1 Tax=Rhodohalobacter barkolensis TaxID=2053187 RepID=A0A2N0VGA5_9BACT|nr:hypothetical protein [Rhodohalobacter barkolensis]PKD43235.1 hypothetical protein CWD77_11515 [Rhodohalobacter barkolensis]
MSTQAKEKVVYVVHSIDTEGPLYESLEATFERLEKIFGLQIEPTSENLRKIQNQKLDLGGLEEQAARVVAPQLINYNDDYGKIRKMLERIGSKKFRNRMPDSYGSGWIYNWHCVDHVGYDVNPRKKDIGFHNIFDFYREFIRDTGAPDKIHWHFHPTHHRNISHLNVNTYLRDNKIFEILARRIIERNWFPSVNRAGFHVERPDSHWFLEQWMPFDLSNQAFPEEDEQADLIEGRFGDWRRSPDDWSIYRPSHDDYQVPGNCRRYIGRCLNVGTRMRCINEMEVRKAFDLADRQGTALMGFTNHDFRDMQADVELVQKLLSKAKSDYPDVKFKYCDAREAFNRVIFGDYNPPEKNILSGSLDQTKVAGQWKLTVEASENTFGPQPFLAVETKDGRFHHDNFDFQKHFRTWSYVFDEHTFPMDTVKNIGLGTNDERGFFHTLHF